MNHEKINDNIPLAVTMLNDCCVAVRVCGLARVLLVAFIPNHLIVRSDGNQQYQRKPLFNDHTLQFVHISLLDK